MEKRNYHNFFNKQQKYDSILLLEDGTKIYGYSFGSQETKIGEICFNTAMTGYQEIITDPSYAGQIINFTFPHIGNVGTNINDIESKKPSVNGIIVRNKITNPSNWRSTLHLNDWLIENNFQGKEGQTIPNMNEEFINLVSNRYIELFEKITSQNFERGDISNLLERVENNINSVIN